MIKAPSRHGITNRRNSVHAIFSQVTFKAFYLRNDFTLEPNRLQLRYYILEYNRYIICYQKYIICVKREIIIKVSFYFNISPFKIGNVFSFDIYDNRYVE